MSARCRSRGQLAGFDCELSETSKLGFDDSSARSFISRRRLGDIRISNSLNQTFKRSQPFTQRRSSIVSQPSIGQSLDSCFKLLGRWQSVTPRCHDLCVNPCTCHMMAAGVDEGTSMINR
eukprot:926283-Amorphochlora_amoeboformis.AAC.1